MKNVTGGRLRRWRPRRRRGGELSGRAPGTDTAGRQAAAGDQAGDQAAAEDQAAAGDRAAAVQASPGEAVAAAVQLAIGLLTASLDSPELEGWAVEALTPHDADGLGNFMAGLHVVSQRLLLELYEATGEQPQDTLQRLAILAEHWRGTPSAG
jgi:hypothetical protein